MEELHFKTNVQIKNIIGKELINDDNIAILELVKNAFDADAKHVDISFKNLKENDDTQNDTYSDKTSRIIIRDDGVGMSLKDIKEKWLNIAYSEKKKFSRQYNRMMAGAKGVGRFSCDRLGIFLNLYAKRDDSTCVLLKIDWRKFEIDDESKEVQSILLDYEEVSSEYLQNQGFYDFEHGVILEILKLRSSWVYNGGNNSWNTDKLTELRKYLEKLINPNQAFETNDFGIFLHAEEFEYENAQKELKDKFIGKVENTIFQKLDFKTTCIECKTIEDGKCLLTTLKDKGEIVYWIKEWSDYFPHIQNFKITLYYLNTYAKAFFTKQTGLRSVNYGSVFLFLNGFRIPPYGEERNDWLSLEQRRAQGYARFMSMRDLVGQVEILDSENHFQIVSSREGLVKNDNYYRLTNSKDGLFYRILRRLERYVVDGLNWDSIPEEDRNKINEIEKKIISGELTEENLTFQEDETTKKQRIYESIHSIINASPKKVIELYVNESLIEFKINEEKRIAEQEFSQLLSDFENKKISGELLAQILKKKAETSKSLEKQLLDFSKYSITDATSKALLEIQSFKEIIEQQTKTIQLLQQQITNYEKSTQQQQQQIITLQEEKTKAEKERDAQSQQNKYLSSVRNTSQEVEDLMHTVLLSSTELDSLITLQKKLIDQPNINKLELIDITKSIQFHIERIHLLSSLITKANTSLLRESTDVDIFEYTQEFIASFHRSIEIQCEKDNAFHYIKKISVMDFSVVLQNLVSNSRKAKATKIYIRFHKDGRKVIMDFMDNGKGVDLNIHTHESIFEVGVTDRDGGSGIGLSTIKKEMVKDLNGDITFIGNNINGYKGACFRLTFR